MNLSNYYGRYYIGKGYKTIALLLCLLFALIFLFSFTLNDFKSIFITGLFFAAMVLLYWVSLRKIIEVRKDKIILYSLLGKTKVNYSQITRFNKFINSLSPSYGGGTYYTIYYKLNSRERRFSIKHDSMERSSDLLKILRYKLKKVPIQTKSSIFSKTNNWKYGL